MTGSDFDLAICLIINTEKPIEAISQIIGIEPTRSINKGESRFAFAPKSESNVWTLRKRYIQQYDIGRCIRDFWETAPNLLNAIPMVKRYGECTLRLSIVSLWGQIAFSLTPADLQLLNKLEISLEVSILSFGDCLEE